MDEEMDEGARPAGTVHSAEGVGGKCFINENGPASLYCDKTHTLIHGFGFNVLIQYHL